MGNDSREHQDTCQSQLIEGMECNCLCGELRKQITTLNEQLAKHGGHTAECTWHLMGFYDGAGEPKRHGKCDCGWAEIDEELGKVND